MDINNKKSALEFIAAWKGTSAARQARMYGIAGSAQRMMAGACADKAPSLRKGYLAAAAVLARAEAKALEEMAEDT